MTSAKYAIFDAMIEGVQIIDPEWRYVYVNDALAVQGKYTKAELLGHTMMERYPGIEHTEVFGHIRACMWEKEPYQMINEFEFPDGSKGFFELRIRPVPEGVLVLSFDVTKQKLAELLLQDTNQLLDKLLHQRNAELNAKSNELEQFTYIASHDLQEPLRTVSTYIHVLKEDYSERLDEAAMSYLNAIDRAVMRMGTLTRALLNFSRLGRDKQLAVVDCNQLLQDVLADLRNLIQSSGAQIDVGPMPKLNAYETELRQLFQNLISNAIKFAGKDNTPVVSTRAARQGAMWRFWVADNGIGIAAMHHERIFEIFQRLHHRDEYDGSGIGLANCKKIVELHGGHISVESTEGKGSTFTFTIADL